MSHLTSVPPMTVASQEGLYYQSWRSNAWQVAGEINKIETNVNEIGSVTGGLQDEVGQLKTDFNEINDKKLNPCITKIDEVSNRLDSTTDELKRGMTKTTTALRILKSKVEKDAEDLKAMVETNQSTSAFINQLRCLNIATKFQEIDEGFEAVASAIDAQTKTNKQFVTTICKHETQLGNHEKFFTVHENALNNHAIHIQYHDRGAVEQKSALSNLGKSVNEIQINQSVYQEKCNSNDKRLERIEKFHDSAFPEILKLQNQVHTLIERVEKQLQKTSNKTSETEGSETLSNVEIEELKKECVCNAAQIDQLKDEYGQLLDELRQLKKTHDVVSERLSPRKDVQLSKGSENHLSPLTQSQKDVISMVCSNSYPLSALDGQPGSQVSPFVASEELASSKVVSLSHSEQSNGDLTKSQKTAM